ncbi:MAG: choice-of-anchor J domain-containing protein [Flavobacterium sp.]
MKKIFKLSLILLTLGLATGCTSDQDMAPYKAIFFSETFDSNPTVGIGQNINLTGWSNVSLNGTKKWEARTYGGEIYAQLSAYNTGETNMNTWLISPAINLDQTTNEALIFDYVAGYYTGNGLSVLVSTDYDGSNTAAAISAATWTDLNVAFPVYSATGYPAFSSTTAADLSQFNGNVYVAFRYLGSSAGINTTYEIDNIKLFENK